MTTQVAVIGAGLAGLAAARTLAEAGHSVRVYEKSRGFGGRLATRRVGADRLDHGAACLVARDPAFRRALEPHLGSVLVPWADRLARWDGTALRTDPLTAGVRRWAAPEGLASLAKVLAAGLDVRLERRVTALTAEPGRWRLTLRPEPEGAIEEAVAGAVVVAIPGPQALALADTAGGAVEGPVRAELGRIAFEPALVVLATFDAPAPGWRAIASESGPIRWIGLESSKRPSSRTTVVVHASAAFSAARSEAGDDALVAELLAAAAPLGGAFLERPVDAELKRWRYARPTLLASARALVSESPLPAAFCGDWCHGPTAEGAYLSGVAAAERLLLARLV